MIGQRLAELVVRRRWWVVAAWIIVGAVLIPPAARLEQELEVAAVVRGSEAVAVEHSLATRFASPFAHFAVLVITGVPAPDTDSGRAVLERTITALDSAPGVTGTVSWLVAGDTLFLAPGQGGTFLIVGLDAGDASLDALVPALRAVTERVVAGLRADHPGATLRWTGEVPINFDLRQTSARESRDAEARALPLTLVLLLLAFGAVAAALLPLVAATFAILISLGAAVLVHQVTPLAVVLQNVVSMIGLGVGIDYALLTVSRFRESLANGRDVRLAATEAAHHAGGTIALSGAAVMIGFAALLLVPLNELQSIGVGGILVVGTSVLMAATLLPALLALLGTRIDAGRIFRRRGTSGAMDERWRSWGRWIVARPWLVLLVAGGPAVLLASEARHLRAELPRGNWLPQGMESALAFGDLARMNRGGVVNSLRVLLEIPEGSTVFDQAGWSATRRLVVAVAADPRVARVQAITSIIPAEQPNPVLIAMLPDAARRSLVARDERATVLDIVPNDGADFTELTALVREIRAMDAAEVTGVRGATIRVGGLPAFNVDYVNAINARLKQVVLLVVLSTLVALMIGFRSILVPLKALALNLLSVACAFGAVVLVFQKGHGISMVGMTAPLDGVFPAVPILVFCIVFGLSMDYEVFLMARVAEARRTMNDDDAIAEGLARTGGVITSAAAIMIAVFAAFTLGDFVFIKVLGFALAVAVLVDATVVRMAIGPALLKLAGRFNWWPGTR